MPIEVATYLSQLNSTYPTLSDDVEDGDDHLRLLKAVLQATFPNFNAPVLAGPSQLNYLRYVTTTNPPVLATDIAAFAVGPFAGVHIAFGASDIQGKSGTAATALNLNKLGGSVNVGPQSGSGTVSLYHSGGIVAQSMATGLVVRDASGAVPLLNLANTSNTVLAQLLFSTHLYLQAAQNSAQVILKSYSSGGAQRSVFSGDPNGNATLYATGSVALQATVIGALVFSTSSDNPEVQLFRSDKATRNAFLIAATTGLSIVNEVHGTPFSLFGEDNGGTQRSLLVGDPDAEVQLFYNGVAKAETTVNGFQVGAGNNVSPDSSAVGHLRVKGSGYTGYLTLDGTGMYLGHNSAIRDIFFQLNNVTRIQLKQGGETSLLRSGADVLITADRAVYGSGVRAVDGAGNLQPVGFNCLPVLEVSSAQSLRVANGGFLFVATASLTFTIDTTTDAAPNGTMWVIENVAGANITITPSGVALVHMNGFDGATGGRTLAPYGYAQVYKRSNGNYRIVGAGVS